MNDRTRQLVIFIIVGALVGIGVYRLASMGRLPFDLPAQIQPPAQISNNRTQTVVEEESQVISTVEQTSPSVIAIGVSQRLVNPFDPFSLPRQQQSTIGTGFVVSDKGIIVTNRHVVADPNGRYSVVTKDGKRLEVQKIYRDPSLDLALVQVSGSDLRALELGDSSKIKVGQTVIAIGNALGRFDNTVTTGVVSGLGRAVVAGDPFAGDAEQLDNLIQTDAAINPGNSGGPLLNLAGQVIGVNVATTAGAENISFAIPINEVKAMVDEFERTGTITRPFLGISYRLITRDVAIMNEVPQGAYIQDVIEGSPADKSGITPGDIITKIDGQPINTENMVSETIQNKQIGQSLSLEVWTDGQTRTVNATLEQAPSQ